MDCLDTGPRSCLPHPSPIPGWGCRSQLPARTHTTSPGGSHRIPDLSPDVPAGLLSGRLPLSLHVELFRLLSELLSPQGRTASIRESPGGGRVHVLSTLTPGNAYLSP